MADTGNHRIRQVRADGVTVTVAGGLGGGRLQDGEGGFALFDRPVGISRGAGASS